MTKHFLRISNKSQAGIAPVVILILIAISAVTTVFIGREVVKKSQIADIRSRATGCSQPNGTPLAYGYWCCDGQTHLGSCPEPPASCPSDYLNGYTAQTCQARSGTYQAPDCCRLPTADLLPDGRDSGCCSFNSQCEEWYGPTTAGCNNANGACNSGKQCNGGDPNYQPPSGGGDTLCGGYAHPGDCHQNSGGSNPDNCWYRCQDDGNWSAALGQDCSGSCSAGSGSTPTLPPSCKNENQSCSQTSDCCSGNNFQCASLPGGKFCVKPTCTENDFKCSVSDSNIKPAYVQKCQNGQWTNYQHCDNGCSNKACISTCTPGGKQCVDNNTALATCTPSSSNPAIGIGWSKASCSSGCNPNRSPPACNTCRPGEKRCGGNGTSVERCNDTGTGWGTNTPCGVNQVCTNGSCLTQYTYFQWDPTTKACTGPFATTYQATAQNGFSSKTACEDAHKVIPTPHCLKERNDDCAFGCTPTVDGGTCKSCSPGAKRCNGTTGVEICDATGTAWAGEDCKGGRVCSNGSCIEQYNYFIWSDTSGSCTGPYTTSDKATADRYQATKESCESVHKTAPTPYCSRQMKDDCAFGCTKTSEGGACNSCSPGSTRCSGDKRKIETCSSAGTGWAASASCASDLACNLFAGTAVCQVVQPPTPTPTPHAGTTGTGGGTESANGTAGGFGSLTNPPSAGTKKGGENCNKNEECASGKCQGTSAGKFGSVFACTKTAEELAQEAKQNEQNLTTFGQVANTVTFGTFGDYVSTYAQQNAQNPNTFTNASDYLANAFSSRGIAASTKLGAVVTAEGAAAYAVGAAGAGIYSTAAAAGDVSFGGLSTAAYTYGTTTVTAAAAAHPVLAQVVVTAGSAATIAGFAQQFKACHDGDQDACANLQLCTQMAGCMEAVGQASGQLLATGKNTLIGTKNLLSNNLNGLSNGPIINPGYQDQAVISTVQNTNVFSAGQSRINKLAQYVTGLPLENEEALVQRVIDDAYAIQEKYGLPPRPLRFDQPVEYINALKQVAQENGVTIRAGNEFQQFFEQNPLAGAVTLDASTVVIPNKDLQVFNQATNYGGNLAHELIHALQHQRYPGMPIEAMEYEAYVGANTGLNNLMERPAQNLEYLFSFISGSSRHWYGEAGIPTILQPSWLH